MQAPPSRHCCAGLDQGLPGPHARAARRAARCRQVPIRPATRISAQAQAVEEEVPAWLGAMGLQPGPLAVREYSGQGRGLCATARIAKGARVVTVPEATTISAQVALEGSSLRPLLERAKAPELTDWSLLALFLAELRHWSSAHGAAHEGSAGALQAPAAIAKWLGYASVLPARPGTVLGWPRGMVQELLQGSPLLAAAQAMIGSVEASWQQLQPLVLQGEQEGLVPPGAITKENVVWAYETLISRTVRLSKKDEMKVLVPWADFLNHSPESTSCLDWEPLEERGPSGLWPLPRVFGAKAGAGAGGAQEGGAAGPGAVVLRADRDIEAGQQIFISYGDKTSGELLLSYGFSPPPAQHPHEAYLLLLDMRGDDPMRAAKYAALAERGLPPAREFPLKLEGLPSGLSAYAALRAARPASGADVAAVADALFGQPPGARGAGGLLGGLRGGGGGLPASLEAEGMQELAELCAARLAGYATTMEQDRRLAADTTAAATTSTATTITVSTAATSPSSSSSSSGGGGRKKGSSAKAGSSGGSARAEWAHLARACAAIRVMERRILERTQFVAAARARELKRGGRGRAAA